MRKSTQAAARIERAKVPRRTHIPRCGQSTRDEEDFGQPVGMRPLCIFRHLASSDYYP